MSGAWKDLDDNGTGPVIVAGVDGSAASLAALRWACTEATRAGARLRVITVVPPDAWHTTATAAARQQVSAMAAVHPEIHLSHQFVVGRPELELVAASRDAVTLVLGRKRRPWLVDLMLGSVPAYCARHAPCPVMLVEGVGANARATRSAELETLPALEPGQLL